MPVTGNNKTLHSLSIRITADGFSFFVTKATPGDVIHRENHHVDKGNTLSQTLAKAAINPTIADYEYDAVRVVVDSHATCIPVAEFRSEDVRNLFQQVFSTLDLQDNLVLHTTLDALGVVVAFTIPKAVEATLRDRFPGAVLTCSLANNLQRVCEYHHRLQLDRQPLFAYLQDKYLHVFSLLKDQLFFANRFEVGEGQNSLYFLLSVWKELKLDAHQNPCFIGGDSIYVQPLIQEVRRYVRHVEEF